MDINQMDILYQIIEVIYNQKNQYIPEMTFIIL
jgi:hypothetical protein